MQIENLPDHIPAILPIDTSSRRLLDIERLEDEHHKDASVAVNGSHRIFLSTNLNPTQEGWQVYTATSKSIDGPWKDKTRVALNGVEGPRLCAPGVVFDEEDRLFHMFIQTECFGVGGKIYHLTSQSGIDFEYKDVALESKPDTSFAGIYDSEPALMVNDQGEKEYYVSFTGFEEFEDGRAVGGAIYLAKSKNRWDGPWEVIETPLLNEYQIPGHLPTRQGGEWVPEGGKITQTGPNEFWFYGVCFLEGEPGNRQRGFLAIADKMTGPWRSLGVLAPKEGKGETGHGTLAIEKKNQGEYKVELIHQARDLEGPWHIETSKLEVTEVFEQGMVNRVKQALKLAWI